MNSTLGDASVAYAQAKKKGGDKVGFTEFIKGKFSTPARVESRLDDALPTDDLSWAEFVIAQTKEFQKEIDQAVDALRKERMNLTIHACERAMERAVGSQAIGLLEEAPRDMWHRMRQMRTAAVEKWDSEVAETVDEFDPNAEELEHFHDNMRNRITEVVEAKSRDASAAALAHMKQAFARVFSKDSKGLPRTWRPLDDVAAINRKAQREALLLARLAASRLDDNEMRRLMMHTSRRSKLPLRLIPAVVQPTTGADEATRSPRRRRTFPRRSPRRGRR